MSARPISTRRDDKLPKRPMRGLIVILLVCIPLLGIALVAAVINPCLIPFLCHNQWVFEAPSFQGVPKQEDVFRECELKKFGFTSTTCDLSSIKTPEDRKKVESHIASVLKTKYSAVFDQEQNKLAAIVIIPPNTSSRADNIVIVRAEKIAIGSPSESPGKFDEDGVKAYIDRTITPIISRFETDIAAEANAVGSLSPKHNGRDLPLLALIQGELTQRGLPFEIPPKFAKEEHFVRFVSNSYGEGSFHRYDQSYAYWVDALVTMKNKSVASAYAKDWPTRINQLKNLSAAYKAAVSRGSPTATGDFAGRRVDGSVFAVAQYALITLRLEGWKNIGGPDPAVQDALANGSFEEIADNLLNAVRKLEGVGEADLRTNETTFSYEMGVPGRHIFGGRLLFFTISAMRQADAQKRKNYMELARQCRQHFEQNMPSSIDPYLYCYLARAAAANARICSQNEWDPWSREWVDFLKVIDGRVGYNSDWSNYYRVLGKLAARNTLADELLSPTEFGRARKK
jgi:hypothetical protein